MARPKIKIDLAQVEDLAAKGLTQKQICQCVGISEDTLQRRKRGSAVFAASMEKGKLSARIVVSNALYDQCRKGNVAAIIWFEKTRCGMSDRMKTQIISADNPPQRPMEHLTDDEIRAIIALTEKHRPAKSSNGGMLHG